MLRYWVCQKSKYVVRYFVKVLGVSEERVCSEVILLMYWMCQKSEYEERQFCDFEKQRPSQRQRDYLFFFSQIQGPI